LGCPKCRSQDLVEENPGKSHGQWGGRMRKRAFGGGPYHFREVISLSIAISRAWLATILMQEDLNSKCFGFWGQRQLPIATPFCRHKLFRAEEGLVLQRL
jgi:hypothetical protein